MTKACRPHKCSSSQFKGEVDQQVGPPAFIGFLDRDYRYKLLTTQISLDAGTGLALIPHTGRKILCHQR